MNIPLDNLYHWIQGLAQHPVILYVFHPHGSKDIFDLDVFKTYQNHPMMIKIICHDQEPLSFSEYEFDHDIDRLSRLMDKREYSPADKEVELLLYSNLSLFPKFNPDWLKVAISLNDWFILLHSEKNSSDVEKFSQTGFCPVYYWNHAIIARDWYRFAQQDRRLDQRHVEKTFLVYCRDWTPNREYRLKFLDLLVSTKLVDDCLISTQHVNSKGVHLKDYKPQDPRFAVDTHRLVCIPDNNSPPTASADYDVNDIISTAVTVVLETVVDGAKIHLTEKILRPIACAHPFVIAAGPGALEYLRSYGFQTFAQFWDESYDAETDTVKRMEMIINTMQQIQQLTELDWEEINKIAEYNKQHFFSKDFIHQVTDELQTNLNHAVNFCLENRGETYWAWRKMIRRFGLGNKSPVFKNDIARVAIQELRKHRSRRFHNKSVPVIGQ
jgi:hypothetical protein